RPCTTASSRAPRMRGRAISNSRHSSPSGRRCASPMDGRVRKIAEHIGGSLGRRLAVDHRIVGFCGSIGSGTLSPRLGLNPSLIDAGVLPELTGDLDRIDAGLLPPGFFVAGAMHRPMMGTAERDGKFIACFAAKRVRLHKSDVMRIRGLAA